MSTGATELQWWGWIILVGSYGMFVALWVLLVLKIRHNKQKVSISSQQVKYWCKFRVMLLGLALI